MTMFSNSIKSSMITEYGCDECGHPIFKIIPMVLNNNSPQPKNRCKKCGYVTEIKKAAKFQWAASLHSTVSRLCTPEELVKLRLDPAKFIPTLNAKLATDNKPEVEFTSNTNPPMIREK